MKFNIVITDTETGETILNENTNCIIGALNKGDGISQGMCIVACNTLDAVTTIQGAKAAGLECCKHNLKIAVGVLLTDSEVKEEKDGAENE